MSLTPRGRHCILELYDCDVRLLDDRAFVEDAVRQATSHGNSTLLEMVGHRFDGQGVTAIGLLAESHLSIHTWPERGYAAIDMFTCGETATPEQACRFLVRHFRAGRHDIRTVLRGEPSAPADQQPVGDIAGRSASR